MSEQGESELDHLATLQELDRHLQDKTELAAVLEREIAAMDLELATQRTTVAAVRADRDAQDQQRRELEARLDEEERKMKDRRMRLNRVRNEKELGALRREIELGKEANQQIESEVLTLMQALELLEARMQEGEATLATLEEKFASERETRRQRVATLATEV